MKKLIVLFYLMLASGWAIAQGFYIKGSTVSLSTQTIMVLPDSLVNNGTFINNGDITISGAWINQGTYVPGNGEINFDNNLTQVINHNDQSIANLTISGGGTKQFLGDITIQSGLTLQDGILESGGGAKIIMDQNVVVTGGSDQSHVKGPVQRSGTGTWTFPIGNGTTYLPAEITGVTDATASATLTLNELTTGQTLTGNIELANLSNQRYWELVLGAGQINASKIKLPMVGEDGLTTNPDMLVVAASNTALTSYQSIGQSAISGSLTAGSLTSADAPSSKYFTVAALLGETGIEVYNAVSPNGDGKNDFLVIRNIGFYPNNRVSIFNRWGDRVFDMSGYDNTQKIFKGESQGSKLPDGTYFYSVDLGDGSKAQTGFLELR